MQTKKLIYTPSVYLWIIERFYVWFVNQVRFIKVFTKFTNAPKTYPLSILDIGCGDGFFLNDIPNSLFMKTGVDISIPKKLPGITYFTGSFEKIKFSQKFDIVVANHVIEHISDPQLFSKKMYSVVKPGGVVMLSTPNSNSLGFKLFKKKWYHYNFPYHKHLFNAKSLDELLTKSGFSKVEIKPEYPGFPMDVIRTLQSAGSRYLILAPVLLLAKIFIPETIVATAKK